MRSEDRARGRLLGPRARCRHRRQAFPRAVIEDGENPETPPADELIGDEIQRRSRALPFDVCASQKIPACGVSRGVFSFTLSPCPWYARSIPASLDRPIGMGGEINDKPKPRFAVARRSSSSSVLRVRQPRPGTITRWWKRSSTCAAGDEHQSGSAERAPAFENAVGY